jgi:hypothetical protein
MPSHEARKRRRVFETTWHMKELTAKADSFDDMSQAYHDAAAKLGQMRDDGLKADFSSNGSYEGHITMTTKNPALIEKHGLEERPYDDDDELESDGDSEEEEEEESEEITPPPPVITMRRRPVFETTWRNKWLMEGVKSYNDMIERLDDAAGKVERMRDDGVEADFSGAPCDYIFIKTTNPVLAEKHGIIEYEVGSEGGEEEEAADGSSSES